MNDKPVFVHAYLGFRVKEDSKPSVSRFCFGPLQKVSTRKFLQRVSGKFSEIRSPVPIFKYATLVMIIKDRKAEDLEVLPPRSFKCFNLGIEGLERN